MKEREAERRGGQYCYKNEEAVSGDAVSCDNGSITIIYTDVSHINLRRLLIKRTPRCLLECDVGQHRADAPRQAHPDRFVGGVGKGTAAGIAGRCPDVGNIALIARSEGRGGCESVNHLTTDHVGDVPLEYTRPFEL